MNFLSGYRRVAAILVMLIPTVASFFGKPIGGEQVSAIIDPLGDLIAGVLVLVSAIKPAPSVIQKP